MAKTVSSLNIMSYRVLSGHCGCPVFVPLVGTVFPDFPAEGILGGDGYAIDSLKAARIRRRGSLPPQRDRPMVSLCLVVRPPLFFVRKSDHGRYPQVNALSTPGGV